MTTSWIATVIVNYDQANLTSLSIGQEKKKHMCMSLGEIKNIVRLHERKELLRRILRPPPSSTVEQNMVSGWFRNVNKAERPQTLDSR